MYCSMFEILPQICLKAIECVTANVMLKNVIMMVAIAGYKNYAKITLIKNNLSCSRSINFHN